MFYIIDTKVFVALILSLDPHYDNEFKECVRESKPKNINISEEEYIKELLKYMKELQYEVSEGRIKIYVTPQLLAEYSNWMEKYVKGERYYKLMEDAIKFFKKSSEHYVKMERMLQEEKILIKFGFTDSSICLCLKDLNKDNENNVKIITSDGELYGFCKKEFNAELINEIITP